MTEVDDFLAHYGVPGMRWGKRNGKDRTIAEQVKRQTDSHTTTMKNGEKLILSGDRTPPLARALAKLSPRMRQKLNDSHSFTLKTSKGDSVGEMFLHKKAADELNVVWVEVSDEHRGKGYATAAMRSAIDVAKKQNLKKITLEVPGHSPDARHIYEKLGFKAGKQLSGSNDIWGGLTKMELQL